MFPCEWKKRSCATAERANERNGKFDKNLHEHRLITRSDRMKNACHFECSTTTFLRANSIIFRPTMFAQSQPNGKEFRFETHLFWFVITNGSHGKRTNKSFPHFAPKNIVANLFAVFGMKNFSSQRDKKPIHNARRKRREKKHHTSNNTECIGRTILKWWYIRWKFTERLWRANIQRH